MSFQRSFDPVPTIEECAAGVAKATGARRSAECLRRLRLRM